VRTRVRVTLRLAVYRKSIRLGDKPLETHDHSFFQLNTCGRSSYVTSSLMRGWVCRLQSLLVLASAVIFKSESRGTHEHILLSQIRDSPNLEDPVIPQALGSFSSPHMTRRAAVEVFDPNSTWDCENHTKHK
jgi:hypothetical protein